QTREPEAFTSGSHCVAKPTTRKPRKRTHDIAFAAADQDPGCGGAGGGIRTHKGLRPEACEAFAFTNFATPAPHRLRSHGKPEGQDANFRTRRRAALRGYHMIAENHHPKNARSIQNARGAPRL